MVFSIANQSLIVLDVHKDNIVEFQVIYDW